MKHQIKIMGSHASLSKVRYLFSLPTRVIAEKFHFSNGAFDHAALDTSSHSFNIGALRSINKKIGNTYVLNDSPINSYGHMMESDIKVTQKVNDFFMSVCNLETSYPEDFSVLTIDFPTGFSCPFLDNEFFDELVSRIPYICVAHTSSGLSEDVAFYSKSGLPANHRAFYGDGALANYFQNVFSKTPVHEDILGETFNHHSHIHHYAELFGDSLESADSDFQYSNRGFSTIDSFLNGDDGRYSPDSVKKLLIHAKNSDKVARLLGTSFGIMMNGVHVAAMAAQMKLSVDERKGLVNIYRRSSLLQASAVQVNRAIQFDTQAECRAKNLDLVNSLALNAPALAQLIRNKVEDVPSLSAWRQTRAESCQNTTSNRTMKNV